MPPGLRMPLQTGVVIPSGVVVTAQPRQRTLLVNEPVRQKTDQMSPFLSGRELKAYSW